MKESWEWLLEDLQGLVTDQIQESLTLDYKSSRALSRNSVVEISKDISSFANSAGGTIVYGIEEKDQKPVRIDDGVDPKEFTREWLEQILNSRIQRRIDGIRVTQVNLPSGRVVFVVSVPQSFFAPHMAADNKYYKRFNFLSVPMEDYEVRDVTRRGSSPSLKVMFGPSRQHSLPLLTGLKNPLGVDVSLFNHSDTPAHHAVIRICVDRRIKVVSLAAFKEGGVGHSFRVDNEYIAVNTFAMNYGIPAHMPIWKEEPFRLNESPIIFSLEKKEPDQPYYLGWVTSAPGMSRQFGICVIKFQDNGQSWGEADRVDEYYPYMLASKKYLN